MHNLYYILHGTSAKRKTCLFLMPHSLRLRLAASEFSDISALLTAQCNSMIRIARAR